MQASGLLSEQRVAGILLILAFISFAIGAGLPTVGEKGNTGIYTLPTKDYLSAVAGNAAVWRWANLFMAAAIVILVAGLTMLTTIQESSGERVLSRLGLVGMLMAAALWLAFSAFRAGITITAAQDMATTGTVPSYYEPVAQWSSALFYGYALIGFFALAAYGGSLLQTTLLPGWAGWVTLIFTIAMLILMLIMGDTLPAFHYVPPLLIGILLVRAPF